MDLQLKGKKALITGGSRGIGRAIAETLADEGCDVAICARSEDGVNAAVEALKGKGVNAYGQAVDVGDGDQLKGWVEASADALGGIDILVSNVSGSQPPGEEGWKSIFGHDILGAVRCVEAAKPHLEKSDAGSIVVISSVSGIEIDFAAGPYGVFKAALIHYAAGLARQLAPKGIRANSVSPGNTYFDGGFWQNIENANPEFFKFAFDQNKFGRMATAEEVANATVFLASPRASFITGTNIAIDGGITAGFAPQMLMQLMGEQE